MLVLKNRVDANQGLVYSTGVQSFVKEANNFTDLTKNIVTQWGEASQDAMGRLFSGTMMGDHIKNGISDYTGLLGIFANGAWSEKINATDILGQDTITLYSQLIPLALYQNSMVRPTMLYVHFLFLKFKYHPNSSI
jgi:hypothetical protein